jgi:hypothetical protein
VGVPGRDPGTGVMPQQSGRIHSFGMDVTPTGSARLRIFAEVSRPGRLASEPRTRRGPQASETRPGRSSGWRLALIAGASIGAYAGWHASALPSLVDVAEFAALFAYWA